MQKEYFGNGSIKRLYDIFDELSPKKVLIVSGDKSYELSGAKTHIEEALGGLRWERYYGFEENPKFSELLHGAKVVKDFAPDLIVAVGGGSVIDTAKIISILPTKEKEAKLIIKNKRKQPSKIVPLVAIPTTSGSGSEATHFAVSYINKEKYSVASEQLLPDYVIVDPELTYSMTPYQTAVSGMDALCQGIESFWAKGATDGSRDYATEAIPLVMGNIEQAVKSPTPAARENMSKGANLAGKAINISKTTAPHALSYYLTSYYGIPHGHAVGLMLGEFLIFNESHAFSNGNENLIKIMKKIFSLLGSKDPKDSKNRFYNKMKKIGLETDLNHIGIKDENSINRIVDSVNIERLNNHPINLSKRELSSLLKNI